MRVAFVLLAAVAFLGAVVAQIGDIPAFPALIETGVQGPANDILNGKPLKVPIIVDPFAKAPGSEGAEVMDQITKVLTMEPPSAAEPVVAAEDQIDVLEILDVAAAAEAKKAGKPAPKAGVKDTKGAKDAKDAKKDEKKDEKKDAKKSALPKDKAEAMSSLKDEISKLTSLIKKAQKIQTELPKKRARLELLKKKLHSAAASTAKDLAGKKADVQAKTAEEVDSKIKQLKEKLAKLEGAKAKLGKSVKDLKSVAEAKEVPASLIAEVESMI